MSECCSNACSVPQGSRKGRAAQVTSILGLFLASIFAVVNVINGMLFIASLFIIIDLPGVGIGIYIQFFAHFLAIVGYSLALCCCVGEKGWKSTAVVQAVLSLLYLISIMCMAVSHGRLDEMYEKHCEDDDDFFNDDNDCDASPLHEAFGILYGCVIANLVFSASTATLLWKAAPEWGSQGVGSAAPAYAAAVTEVELASTKA